MMMQTPIRGMKTNEKLQEMEDISDIMSMMQKVEVPRDTQTVIKADGNGARVTHHEEDMLTVKSGDASWQFGKVLSIFEG